MLPDTVASRRSTRMAGLDLKGGVTDLEALAQPLLEAPNEVLAVRGVEVLRNHHVGTQGELLAVERPTWRSWTEAIPSASRIVARTCEVHAMRSSLEEDVRRFAHDPQRAPSN